MKILIAMLAVILIISGTLLEWAITGGVFWSGIVMIIGFGMCSFYWVAGKFIEAIDFMTRFER